MSKTSSSLFSNNSHVKTRRPSRSPFLRDKMMDMQVGEVLYTNNPDIKRLAPSLSRSARKTSGTRFAYRLVRDGEWEVQLVKEYTPPATKCDTKPENKMLAVNAPLIYPAPKPVEAVVPPTPTEHSVAMAEAEVLSQKKDAATGMLNEFRALYTLMGELLQRFETHQAAK